MRAIGELRVGRREPARQRLADEQRDLSRETRRKRDKPRYQEGLEDLHGVLLTAVVDD